ncbi:MAG: DUF418 domain-containing protein [Wenzhouxiangella sp.]
MTALTASGNRLPDGRQRIESLDALRGFAIFGILLINIQVFSGYGFLGVDGRAGLPGSTHDEAIAALVDVLVRGRFYSLFSLLFGYSFVMMAQKTPGNARSIHLRRMLGLFLVGIAHSVLFWPWDILVLYALLGMLLPPFLRCRPQTLAVAGLVALMTAALASFFGPVIGLPDSRGEFATQALQDSVPVLAGGHYIEVVRANLLLTVSIFVEWLQGLRPLRVFAMFLLGAAAATLGLAAPGTTHGRLIWTAMLIGLGLGLVLAIVGRQLDPDTLMLRAVWVAANTGEAPLLAIGYAAILTLWWNSASMIARATRSALAPVGRMALTNYLLQSVVCVPLFYGFGIGWFANLSLGSLILFSVALFLCQMVFSKLWLHFFRQGPVEWLWRCQTHGKRLTMRQAHKIRPSASRPTG